MTNENFLPTDELGYGGISFGTSPNVSSDDVYRTGDAFMGRLHYVYDQRYLITATVRRDGYSAFGLANRVPLFRLSHWVGCSLKRNSCTVR